MEGLSIVIPVFNQIESTEKCISSIRNCNKDSIYEIIVVDNGSTDNTEQFFSSFSSGSSTGKDYYGEIITYIRNEENLGVSKALNRGAGAAKYSMLCFMHNDVFVFRDNWTAIITEFIKGTPNTGIVGFYGAKTMRKDGSFRGKTIIHSMKSKPSIRRKYEGVSVVDGLLMAMHRSVFEKGGGYYEEFPVHFYDKDISMRAVKNGYDNYVLNVPFEHVSATTRKEIQKDNAIRDEAQEKFIAIWSNYLPADVTTWREKISYAVKRKKDC